MTPFHYCCIRIDENRGHSQSFIFFSVISRITHQLVFILTPIIGFEKIMLSTLFAEIKKDKI